MDRRKEKTSWGENEGIMEKQETTTKEEAKLKLLS